MAAPRTRAALAGLALLAPALGARPALAQDPPAPVVVAVSDARPPTFARYRSCAGQVAVLSHAGVVALARTGPVDGELTVPLALSGDLVGALDPVPAAARFRSGEATAHVVLEVPPGAARAGALVVALVEGDGYALGPPATADVSAAAPPAALSSDCTAPYPLAPGRATQVIAVGEVPAPLGIRPRDGRDLPPSGVVTSVVGALPPGLTYDGFGADVWGGAATTPGTYRFGISVCHVPSDDGLDSSCPGTARVAITVLGDDGPGPPAAAPAAPVPAPARFTG